jgi:hypothetical protein
MFSSYYFKHVLNVGSVWKLVHKKNTKLQGSISDTYTKLVLKQFYLSFTYIPVIFLFSYYFQFIFEKSKCRHYFLLVIPINRTRYVSSTDPLIFVASNSDDMFHTWEKIGSNQIQPSYVLEIKFSTMDINIISTIYIVHYWYFIQIFYPIFILVTSPNWYSHITHIPVVFEKVWYI